jgi:hypothetical protein
LLRVVAAVVI